MLRTRSGELIMIWKVMPKFLGLTIVVLLLRSPRAQRGSFSTRHKLSESKSQGTLGYGIARGIGMDLAGATGAVE